MFRYIQILFPECKWFFLNKPHAAKRKSQTAEYKSHVTEYKSQIAGYKIFLSRVKFICWT